MGKSCLFLLLSITYWICSNAVEVMPQLGDQCENSDKEIQRSGTELTNHRNKTQLEAPTSCDPSSPLECVNGRCNCKRGYTISRNGTKCLEIARNGLESLCEESIQCWKSLLGRLSECETETGKCSCYESETLPIVFHQGR